MLLDTPIQPDGEALVRCLRRTGTPRRVHFFEHGMDGEIIEALFERFAIDQGLDPNDPWHWYRRYIELQRVLGYDFVSCGIGTTGFPRHTLESADTAPEGQRRQTRSWTDESTGPITSWEEFERYPWPDPEKTDTSALEWCSANVPDDMCLRSGACQIFEQVSWLMGHETLCLAIFDEPDLVDAMFQRVGEIHLAWNRVICQFPRVALIYGGDDMGFKTQTMIQPRVLIEKCVPWHARMARLAHEHGKLYLLHSCGNLEAILPALLDAGMDGKHSFEDVIEPVTEAKKRWGDRIALLGGIDMDFLCRADEAAIRRRVRETLDVCQPGGGYCLGTGNTVANYVPIESYLVMLDEGRRYGG